MGERSLEVVDVGVQLVFSDVAHRTCAGVAFDAAETWLLLGTRRLDVTRKVLSVAAGTPSRVHLALESGQTRGHVGGIRDLAHFAVVDHVDTRSDLLANTVANRRSNALGK